MNKIKEFFLTVWDLITCPFTWRKDKDFKRKLTQIAAEDRATLLNEKDVEFLRSIGVETTLKDLRNECKSIKKSRVND